MKKLFKILTVALFMLPFFTAKAQGNLQFNQAIFISMTLNQSYTVIETYDTLVVPTGKIVKITSFSTGGNSSFRRLAIDDILLINYVSSSNYPSSNYQCKTPIWLPAGTYVFKLMGNSNHITKAFISGVEFNIVQ